MGRFSPTVLPTAVRSPLSAALLGGVDSYFDERDKLKTQRIQREQADNATTAAKQAFVRGGGRYGTAPADPGTDISVQDTTGDFNRPSPPPPHDAFSAPSSAELARGLRGTPAAAAPDVPITGADLRPSTPPIDWGAALRGDPAAAGSGAAGLTPSASGGTTPVAPTAPLVPVRTGGASHPGGFDPVTHTFGGTPQRAAADDAATAATAATAAARPPATVTHLGPTGRYVQIDPTHYQDTAGSEDAMNREAQRMLAAALAGQKYNAQETLQDKKGQQGEAHDERLSDRALGTADETTGPRSGGTIAARGAQTLAAVDERGKQAIANTDERSKVKTPPLTRYASVQGADGRLWLRSVNDPSDVRPLTGPDGAQITGHLPTAGGAGGIGGGMGSGGIGGIARQAAAITGMQNAHENMLPFEENVRTGKADYTGLDYFQGRLAKMYDAHGVVNDALHAATFADLDDKNPALANYLRAAEQWALEDGSLSGRSSDFRTKLDSFISAIGPRAAKSQIDQTQKFRGTRLEELQKFKPAMEAMGSRAAGGGRPTAAAAAPPSGATPPVKPAPNPFGAFGDLVKKPDDE